MIKHRCLDLSAVCALWFRLAVAAPGNGQPGAVTSTPDTRILLTGAELPNVLQIVVKSWS
jgi:hypothetical protein